MTTFFISDTHFGHANIIRFCDRPFADVEEMNAALIENWNAVVSDDDTVYHLGDVALGKWVEWDGILSQLNGYKILVVGNHERIFKGESEKNRRRFAIEYPKWFEEIHHNIRGLELANGTKVNLSHFPYEADHMEKARHMDARLIDRGVPLVHGHTHLDQIISHSRAGSIQIHVGADAHNYAPITEQQVIDYIRVAGDVEGGVI